MRRIAISLLLTITACGMLSVMAASKHIGIAMGKGDIRVDKTSMKGNATLFSGAVVETGDAVSSLLLSSGAEYQLGPQSQARIFEDKLVLDRGTAELLNGGHGSLAVGLVSIRAGEGGSLLRVTRSSEGFSEVAALRGAASLYSPSGELIASIPTGLGLAFDPQSAGAAPPVKIHGLVRVDNGRYFLTDCQSGKAMELTGEDLGRWVGKAVEVSGSIDVGEGGSVFRGAWFAGSDKPCHIPAEGSQTASGTPGNRSKARTVASSKAVWVIVGSAGAAGLAAGVVASGSDSVSR